MTIETGAAIAVAVGTVVLAIVTAVLAIATFVMARATRRLANETATMAAETRRIADANERVMQIEAERFEDEQRPELRPVRWDGTVGLMVQNVGRAPALLVKAEVGKPWRRYAGAPVPIAPGATTNLSTFNAMNFGVAAQPSTDGLPAGQTLARVEWDGGDSGYVPIADG